MGKGSAIFYARIHFHTFTSGLKTKEIWDSMALYICCFTLALESLKRIVEISPFYSCPIFYLFFFIEKLPLYWVALSLFLFFDYSQNRTGKYLMTASRWISKNKRRIRRRNSENERRENHRGKNGIRRRRKKIYEFSRQERNRGEEEKNCKSMYNFFSSRSLLVASSHCFLSRVFMYLFYSLHKFNFMNFKRS